VGAEVGEVPRDDGAERVAGVDATRELRVEDLVGQANAS
jgi:hypothetical protein